MKKGRSPTPLPHFRPRFHKPDWVKMSMIKRDRDYAELWRVRCTICGKISKHWY